MISNYRCLGCNDPLPAYRGSYCDACLEWNDTPITFDPSDGPPGVDDIDPSAPADPDPAPGRAPCY